MMHRITTLEELDALYGTPLPAALAKEIDHISEHYKAFIEKAEATLAELNADQQQAEWVKSTYITDDTEAIAAKADEKLIAETVVPKRGISLHDQAGLVDCLNE